MTNLILLAGMSTILQISKTKHRICHTWLRWFSSTTCKGTLKKDTRGFNQEGQIGKGKPLGIFTKQGMMVAKRKFENVPISPHIELVYHNNSTELYLRPTTFLMIPFLSTFAYINLFDSGVESMVRNTKNLKFMYHKYFLLFRQV